MNFSITCDDSNNNYMDSLAEQVNVHIKFEGINKTYCIVLKPTNEVLFEDFRQRCYTLVKQALSDIDGRHLATEITEMLVEKSKC